MRRINEAGLALVKSREGCRLRAYRDPVGIWTVGYGSTGPHVKPGLVLTQREADELLLKDLGRFERGVANYLGDVRATDNEFAAMVSLAFNVGLGAFGKSSVLRHHLAGHRLRAAASFLLWVKAGGKTLRGLVARRNEERRLYLS